MHIYDRVFDQGIHVHLSVNDLGAGYIIVRDIYTQEISMKWFTRYDDFTTFLSEF
jgi:hypothetical protein